MRAISYIRYFYFLAVNWNLRIAWYMIRQEIKGEKKYGISTTGSDELLHLEKMGIDTSHATIYMPVSYLLLEEILAQLPNHTQQTTNNKQTHFLDIGCGKGRALCVAAHHGFTKVTGLDISRALCDMAKVNLQATKEKIPALEYKVINNDAFYFDIPDDVEHIFFFNPFDEIVMTAVVNNIMESLRCHRRRIYILYVNPLHKDVFLKAGFKETWHSKKLKYIEASILTIG